MTWGDAEAKTGNEAVRATAGPEASVRDLWGVQVWGVLNVTPDSFSDGGSYHDPGAAVERAAQMVEEGVDVVDVGGASSRPRGPVYAEGAAVVPPAEELQRVLPVLRRLVRSCPRPLSIDTTSAEVAAAATAEGVSIVNDVSCAANPDLLRAVVERGAQYVLMHTRSAGQVQGAVLDYGSDVIGTVRSELAAAMQRVVEAGVPAERIWLDPGLGFAKTPWQSLAVLAGLPRLLDLGAPLLVGASRKGFLATYSTEPEQPLPPPRAREAASLSAVAAAVQAGARAVRVHDVRSSVQAARLASALRHVGGGRP